MRLFSKMFIKSRFFNCFFFSNQVDNFTIADDYPIKQRFCNLHPYTCYNMTVDVMPERGGYWSDPVMITVCTDESGKKENS